MGAEVNARDNRGWTPLVNAARIGNLEIVKTLIENGADVNVSGAKNWTALLLATRYKHSKIAKILIERGADVNVRTVSGWTPLMMVAFGGDVKIAKLLVWKGADVSVKRPDGWTALLQAARKGHTEIVLLLIEEGADVNVSGNEGWTSLMLAAYEGNIVMVDGLVDAGADINAKNSKGESVMTGAVYSGKDEIIAFLTESGAKIAFRTPFKSVIFLMLAALGLTVIACQRSVAQKFSSMSLEDDPEVDLKILFVLLSGAGLLLFGVFGFILFNNYIVVIGYLMYEVIAILVGLYCIYMGIIGMLFAKYIWSVTSSGGGIVLFNLKKNKKIWMTRTTFGVLAGIGLFVVAVNLFH